MNNKTLKTGARIMIVLSVIFIATGIAAAQTDSADNENTENAYKMIGAGLALGLTGIGTGMSQGQIGAAAVGMLAEDSDRFTHALIFTALPETIVLFGFLAMFLL
tara:strand:+ start:94 stop:408 length:315 start_codon:yes stop_codon:yes gene_type:complete